MSVSNRKIRSSLSFNLRLKSEKSKLKIKKGVTIGLKATIMGDVEIGKYATIAPHEVVLPKSKIPEGKKPETK